MVNMIGGLLGQIALQAIPSEIKSAFDESK